MAAFVPLIASAGSFVVRVLGESDINENTTQFLAKKINIEVATRIISENITYYVSIVTFKAVCDIIVVSVVGRKLYHMFQQLWKILEPLLKLGLKGFIDGIAKCEKCIQASLKELLEKGVSFHTIYDKVRPHTTVSNVLKALDGIYKFICSAKAGFCYTIKFELTKYYLEIVGFIRALCEKLNINFLKYLAQADVESNNGEDHAIEENDGPLTYLFEVSLEQLLQGTEENLPITREVQKINQPIRQERQIYTIKIEPGCKEGHVIRLPQVGNRDPINIPADLLVTIRSKPHPLFKREGANLIYVKTLSYADSRSGNRIEVPLLSGEKILVDPKGPIDINKELAIPGHGLPNPDRNGERGQLLVRFDIQAPTNQVLCDDITVLTPTEGISIDQIH
ncbi:unnamed protein product [Adineta ricciae]|uniref:Chaperone DnaJ C-terminal domain-containing protein n=1 Tax=Adineta ricciae TaxID=249248 RepID=A0A815LVX9_ADIRI|nr:unnamed protein product [Adineta ricciae]CAF1415967.1 unnamed protein product [Adineta ricciae]